MATKLIYGSGRIPKSSEFVLGDIIVNVDDSKVFSKSKSNVVFEIGASTTNTVESQAFTTASLHTSSFDAILTSGASPNLVISGGVGIQVTTGSQVNSIILNATGESIASVTVANTASYVQAGNIDGLVDMSSQTNFSVSDTSGQTGINLTFGSNDTLSGVASGLGTTDNVKFANITSSANISSSGDIISSRFIASGSNVTSGFVFPNPDDLTDFNTNRITLTSAKNMQFRAGNVFQFTKTVEILASESLMLKNADNNGRVLLENAGVGNESRLRIRTGSVELVTVSGSGNVGIGKATPGEKLEVSGSISASDDILAKRLRLPQSEQGSISEGGIIFGTEGSHGQILDDGNSLQIGYDGSDVLTVSGSDPYTKLLINGNTRIASGHLFAEGNITASGILRVDRDISGSGALFASMSTTDNSDFKTVVYDEDTGKFSITGSYSAGGQTITGTDTQVLFFDNNVPVGDSGFLFNKNRDSVNIAGNITSSNALLPGNGAGIQLGNSAGSNSIKFVPNLNPNSAFSGEVSAFADVSCGGFKQSLNFFNLTDEKHISLSIGESEYFKANFAQGAKADKAFIINGDDTSVDFIVSGSNFPDLLVAGVDSDNVGIGFGSSSLSANYSLYKLAVSGNLFVDGYVKLNPKNNTTGVAGALLYSASNEFYLGFS